MSCPIVDCSKLRPSKTYRKWYATTCMYVSTKGVICGLSCKKRKEQLNARCEIHLGFPTRARRQAKPDSREKKEERVPMKTRKVSEMTEQELKNAKYIMNLKGKDYCTVAYRLLRFREEHPTWSITKEIIHRDDVSIIVKCSISDDQGRVIAEDFAEEMCRSHLPTIEKASTDAMGRALANLGYATSSIASYEEMKRFEGKQQSKPRTTQAPTNTQQSPNKTTPTHLATKQPRRKKSSSPEKTPEQLEQELSSNLDWMSEKFPWKLTKHDGIAAVELTWAEIPQLEKVKSKDGKVYGYRQYLRILETKTNDPLVAAKCKVAANHFKSIKNKESKDAAQAELFGNNGKEVNQYSTEGVGA